jgi:DNA recombination protein RmuC
MILQFAILLGILMLMLRKDPLGPLSALFQKLAEAIAGLTSQSDRLEADIRAGIQEIRQDLAAGMGQAREDASRFFDQVRRDSSDLRELVTLKLQNIAEDAARRHTALIENTNDKLIAIGQALSVGQTTQSDATVKMKETVESTLSHLGRELRENTQQLTEEVKNRLKEVAEQLNSLSEANERRQEGLRQTVEGRLEKLQESNVSKLEEMRTTVDEKLHSTLERRLTESFSLVAERLENVHTGLGEMKDLALGVGDLKRVLTNVRARGSLGEIQCGAQLDQILSPDQYLRNAVIREDSRECVEFAIKIPNGDQEMLLPIDVKFPREDWERLEEAMEHGTAEDKAAAQKALAATVRAEAKKISEKYIYPPRTTEFALMYLPTEGLFAEVIRIPGLFDDLQTHLHVSVAGPTNFVAILNSLQMGFRTVAIQKKGTEVWRVLGAAKLEFQKFGGLMLKVETQVGTVQNTLREIRGKTKTITRALRNVETAQIEPVDASKLLGFEEQAVLPLETGRVLEMAASAASEGERTDA